MSVIVNPPSPLGQNTQICLPLTEIVTIISVRSPASGVLLCERGIKRHAE